MCAREILFSYLSHTPNWGPGPQPRHVPSIGISDPSNQWPFIGEHSTRWANKPWLPSFLLSILGWHWLIKLYRFWVYNFIIHHLFIVLCVHHSKSSLLPSPFILSLPSSTSPHTPFHLVITQLLSVSINFLAKSFYLFTQPPTPYPSDICHSVLSIYDSVSILFVSLFCTLDSIYKSEII